jgi:hypothetical protein
MNVPETRILLMLFLSTACGNDINYKLSYPGFYYEINYKPSYPAYDYEISYEFERNHATFKKYAEVILHILFNLFCPP